MAKKKVLILTADNFEDSELLCPMNRLLEAGYAVDIAAPKVGKVTGKHGYEVEATMALEYLAPTCHGAYALLLLPGGKAPAEVRKVPESLEVAKSFMIVKKPVAAICHGPQVLASAGVLQGRKATCYASVAEELKAAGAKYKDAEVVVDDNLVTSRQPSDIPAFNKAIMKLLG